MRGGKPIPSSVYGPEDVAVAQVVYCDVFKRGISKAQVEQCKDGHHIQEHGLLFAVLDRACRDLEGVGVLERESHTHTAKTWFLSDDMGPFSFLWVCSHLGLEPYWFRQGLFELGLLPWNRRFRWN